jgi:hypothetical protein
MASLMKKLNMISICSAFYCLLLMAPKIWSTTVAPSEPNINTDKISLTAENEPLGSVLEKIAEKSGYVVTISSEFTNLPVSISFQELTLEQALWRVLGQLNRYIIVNKAERRITFGLVDPLAGLFPASKVRRSPPENEMEIVPPIKSGGSSATLNDIKRINQSKLQNYQNEVELVPPDTNGTKNLFSKDIKDQKYNQDELELVPPD